VYFNRRTTFYTSYYSDSDFIFSNAGLNDLITAITSLQCNKHQHDVEAAHVHVTTSHPGKGSYCLRHFLWHVMCALQSSIQGLWNKKLLCLIGWGPKDVPLWPSVAHKGSESDSPRTNGSTVLSLHSFHRYASNRSGQPDRHAKKMITRLAGGDTGRVREAVGHVWYRSRPHASCTSSA